MNHRNGGIEEVEEEQVVEEEGAGEMVENRVGAVGEVLQKIKEQEDGRMEEEEAEEEEEGGETGDRGSLNLEGCGERGVAEVG